LEKHHAIINSSTPKLAVFYLSALLVDHSALYPVPSHPSCDFKCPTSTHGTIAAAITAAAPSGDTIAVAAGTYAENITINKALILQGAGAASTTISGTGATGSSIITITSPNVTITGFKITNPNSKYGINVANQSGITITNNTITNIGGSDTTTTSDNFGIAVSSSSAAVANVTITNNTISNISNVNTGSSKSATAIVAGFSTGASDITNLLIQGNAISGITAGKGAYGILLNHASGVSPNTGRTVSPQIKNNTISTLNGLWAHGIGLEGGTPNAVVQGNNISNLTLTPSTGSDASAITLESNAWANTVTIASNSFTGVLYGVLNITATNPPVTVGSNWWGCTAGANGGVGCAATYPTTGGSVVNTAAATPCANSTCTSTPVSATIDLRSSPEFGIINLYNSMG
jgi:hypothetical protein